jgi:hypothetical protein
MEEYITLHEIYIHDSSLFKNKNFKNFIKVYNVESNNMVKLKNNKIGIKSSWIKEKIPSFNIKLKSYDENKHSSKFFDTKKILEKYGCKTFNPIKFNLNSSTIQYFLKDDERKPFFTSKGLYKIMVFYNDISDNTFQWINELEYGKLKDQKNQLCNIIEMVNSKHSPIIRIVNNEMVTLDHFYDINNDDIIIDFKKIYDFKIESDLKSVHSFKCPLYTQLQKNFYNGLKEAEKNYETKLKDLNQEKVIQYYQQELKKEKSLKDQMTLLTQSLLPHLNDEMLQPSLSSEKNNGLRSSLSSEKILLKPSKIK